MLGIKPRPLFKLGQISCCRATSSALSSPHLMVIFRADGMLILMTFPTVRVITHWVKSLPTAVLASSWDPVFQANVDFISPSFL